MNARIRGELYDYVWQFTGDALAWAWAVSFPWDSLLSPYRDFTHEAENAAATAYYAGPWINDISYHTPLHYYAWDRDGRWYGGKWGCVWGTETL